MPYYPDIQATVGRFLSLLLMLVVLALTYVSLHLTVEAVALTVQIYLQQNRTDLAVKEVVSARRWAQDSLLVNLAESWVGLRVVRCPLARHRIP